MLYHPNSPYYRQFLTVTAKSKKRDLQIGGQQTKAAANMPNINPGSVGLWVHHSSEITQEGPQWWLYEQDDLMRNLIKEEMILC